MASLRGQVAERDATIKARETALRKAESEAVEARRRTQAVEREAADARARADDLAAQLLEAQEEYSKL